MRDGVGSHGSDPAPPGRSYPIDESCCLIHLRRQLGGITTEPRSHAGPKVEHEPICVSPLDCVQGLPNGKERFSCGDFPEFDADDGFFPEEFR